MGRKISVSTAAKITGWHRDTVIRAIKRGRLPAERTPGGWYRIDREDLDKVRKVQASQ